jgi:hypothetical protein
MPRVSCSNPDIEARRRQIQAERWRVKAGKTQRDQGALSGTGIRTRRAKPVFTTPNVFGPAGLEADDVDADEEHEPVEPQHSYVCKQKYSVTHAFYDQMRPTCAEFNYAKRSESADLIGYQVGIKLLRASAHRIVTTRFQRDSAARFAAEADFDQ